MHVDLGLLYDPPDEHFVDWVEIVADRVRATRDRQNSDANPGG